MAQWKYSIQEAPKQLTSLTESQNVSNKLVCVIVIGQTAVQRAGWGYLGDLRGGGAADGL